MFFNFKKGMNGSGGTCFVKRINVLSYSTLKKKEVKEAETN